ncbi:putative LRR receptor-like serine/threonine-protein kinase RFK1 [Vitis vinifera]|uniref:non-specific serine/threonine protein kinase n=1 Tax=Vitis vinifera TaxID=29760 RepID=A0A438G291_VITVI|nr:putative LRR receptor-like serine/threonine-protein kinase RFK1 [Vitis vinifera]
MTKHMIVLGNACLTFIFRSNWWHKDFNIEDEARGARKPVMKQFNTSVTNNVLEIRFYWAGKGTTRIPSRGVYGPLISAISVHPRQGRPSFLPHRSRLKSIRTSYEDFKSCSSSGKKGMTAYIIGGVVGLCIILLILGFLQWKGCLRGRKREEKDPEGLDLQTSSFTLKQIKNATNNFDSANKIGEGGLGLLSDGTTVAVKQLSSGSRQGDQLLLVYEYMENNSLARALFGPENSQLILDWPTRLKICIGIAKGLAFLHEESRLKIVHRDIKATNVLLDRDLNPKISDFGLARLDDGGKSHISTRIAGTIGYMAPEYALRGYLTYKADVYSFGIVVLEIFIVSVVHVPFWCFSLLRLKCTSAMMEVKKSFKSSIELSCKKERYFHFRPVICNKVESFWSLLMRRWGLKPTMSEVVSMLEGRKPTPDIILEPNSHNEDVRFKAIRDFRQEKRNQSLTGIQTQNSTAPTELYYSSASGVDFCEINPASKSC